MATTIALISILLLGAIVLLLLLGKLRSPLEKLLFIIYSFNLVTEVVMMITSQMSIKNHAIANVHILVFGIGMLLICSQIWQQLFAEHTSFTRILFALIFYITVWFCDNFIIHTIDIFNPLSQSIIFGSNLIFTVYLLSSILFITNSPFRARVETMLVIGCIIYAANNVIIDFFFNYYMHLSNSTYLLISEIGLCIIVVAHLCVCIGVWRLIRSKNAVMIPFSKK